VYDKPHLLVRARASMNQSILKMARSVDSNGAKVAEQWISRLEEERRRRPHNFQRGRSRRATKEERTSLQALGSGDSGAAGVASVGMPVQLW
jgi:transposase